MRFFARPFLDRPPAWPLAVVGLLCCIASLAGCGSADDVTAEAEDESLPTLEAEVLSVQSSRWPAVVRSQGSLVADEVAEVGAEVAGRVAEVHVDLGDLVRAGEPLVALDQEEFQFQVEQAEAQLAQARSAVGLKPDDPVERLNPENAPPVRQERAVWDEAKTSLERAERLREQNAISAGEYDQFASAERVAEARYTAALNGVHEKIALIGVREAELELARQRLRDATIRAPFDALVQERRVAPGTYLSVGDPIAVLVRSDPLRFRGTVPERHAQSLAVGQQVELQIESVESPQTVSVTRISPALDLQSRSLLFEAVVDNPDRRLRTGLFAEAKVVVDPEAEALIVPRSAVVEFAGTEKVWVVEDGVAGEREVFLGGRREEGIEVLNGLEPGDVILRDADRGRVALVRAPAEPPEDPDREQAGEQREELAGRDESPRGEPAPPVAAG